MKEKQVIDKFCRKFARIFAMDAKTKDDEKQEWFTTENGTHVHLEEGESKKDAIERKFGPSKSAASSTASAKKATSAVTRAKVGPLPDINSGARFESDYWPIEKEKQIRRSKAEDFVTDDFENREKMKSRLKGYGFEVMNTKNNGNVIVKNKSGENYEFTIIDTDDKGGVAIIGVNKLTSSPQ